jgi:hypothetical protein
MRVDPDRVRPNGEVWHADEFAWIDDQETTTAMCAT